jgi:RimJ/RimL family protein N-acetyltransferase
MWYHNLNEEKDCIRFIIETKSDGAVGQVMLSNIDWKNRSAQTGIMIAKEHHSKGFALDASMTRQKYAFEELQLNRLEGHILDNNKASQRLAEKAGFKVEGTRRRAVYKNGKYHDVVIVAILKEDYDAKVIETNYWSN